MLIFVVVSSFMPLIIIVMLVVIVFSFARPRPPRQPTTSARARWGGSPPPKNVGRLILQYVDHLIFSLLTYSNRLNKFYIKIRYLPHKHNSTMVSDTSPGIADPKMKESFVYTAQTSWEQQYAQDGYLKCPHPTIIDGDMWSNSGWFLGGFGVVRHLTRD